MIEVYRPVAVRLLDRPLAVVACHMAAVSRSPATVGWCFGVDHQTVEKGRAMVPAAAEVGVVGSAGLLRGFGRVDDRPCDGFEALVLLGDAVLDGRRALALVLWLKPGKCRRAGVPGP